MAPYLYRHLTLRREERILNGQQPSLLPGEASFRSFYIPSLQGGLHTISVTQNVSAPEKSKEILPITGTSQKFHVQVPLYNLAPALIDSVSPPPGEGALNTLIPHLVLKDPFFPWERPASKNDKFDGNTRTPWVALLVFTADELRLEDSEKANIFGAISSRKDNANFGFDLNVSDLGKIQNATNRIPISKESSREFKESTSLICLRRDLVRKLFFNQEGKGDVSQFKFLSHVRTVATEGMSAAEGDTTSTYSIVISNRLAPPDVPSPTPVFAHLVSIQNIEDFPASSVGDFMVFTSLHSWSYNALPPSSFRVRDALRTLGSGLSVLRTQRTATLTSQTSSIEEMVSNRQNDGFTIVSHRVITGEKTAALYRGPLTPTFVKYPLFDKSTIQSNFGTDLQILDPNLSLMDISYAAAWQLGKTLGIGDTAFSTALCRLRHTIHEQALQAARISIKNQLGEHVSRTDVVSSISSMVRNLNNINEELQSSGLASVGTNRWQRLSADYVDMTLRSPHIMSQMFAQAVPIAIDTAKSIDGNFHNYHSVPRNTDYSVVQNWILNKMHLEGIPAHYFLPDASHLPEETLRFFYIDENWTSAFIDGALSLANHFTSEPDEDFSRSAIKEALNTFLTAPMPALGYLQQLPKYGFLMRSKVLSEYPDLMVSAIANQTAAMDSDISDPEAPVLVQRMLAQDCMLVLFDRAPPTLQSLKFSLPPHQQTFAIGTKLDEKEISITFRRLYTKPPADQSERLKELLVKKFPNPEMFDWDSRIMKAQTYAQAVFKTLEDACKPGGKMKPGEFAETEPTSALLALQLNEPIYTLDIVVAPTSSSDFEILPEKRKTFLFHYPPFPAHKYIPTSLPKPLSIPIYPRHRLKRHVPRTVPILSQRLPPLSKDVDEALARRIFQFKIRTIDNENFVPTNCPVNPDLIFSIVVPEQWRSNWPTILLQKLTIMIPRGKLEKKVPIPQDGNKPGNIKPLVTLDYDPPMPVMLSNLRFNVLKSFSDKYLILKVVPRNDKGVALAKIKEASFMLAMVDLLPWTEPGQTYVYMYVSFVEESYNGENGCDVNFGPETRILADEQPSSDEDERDSDMND